MVAPGKRFLLAVLLLTAVPALAKTGVPFNPLTNIHCDEFGLKKKKKLLNLDM